MYWKINYLFNLKGALIYLQKLLLDIQLNRYIHTHIRIQNAHPAAVVVVRATLTRCQRLCGISHLSWSPLCGFADPISSLSGGHLMQFASFQLNMQLRFNITTAQSAERRGNVATFYSQLLYLYKKWLVVNHLVKYVVIPARTWYYNGLKSFMNWSNYLTFMHLRFRKV